MGCRTVACYQHQINAKTINERFRMANASVSLQAPKRDLSMLPLSPPRIILSGFVGNTEGRQTKSGREGVANLTLATSERWKDKTGQVQ
jgi:hypothetical protein